MADVQQIALKGGVNFTLDWDVINSPDFPVESFRHLVALGVKAFLTGKGMTKLAVKDLEGEELEEVQAKIKEVAEKNFQDLCDGKIGRTARGGAKMPAAVKARMMQIATAYAKDSIKRQGYKWGAYSAADKKEMALQVLDIMPGIAQQAKDEIEAQGRSNEAPVLLADFAKELLNQRLSASVQVVPWIDLRTLN